MIVGFTWDWSSWYAAVLYILGGLVLIGTFVGQVYGFWAWLAGVFLDKIRAARPINRVPRTRREEAVLVARRPDAWEYLLFAAVLLRERDSLDPQLRDHELGYTKPHGPRLSEDEAYALLSGVLGEASGITSNVERLLSVQSQDRAFAPPGQPGDPERIEHLAVRLIDVYRELLEWSGRVRGAVVPEEYQRAFELAAQFVSGPIRQIREWVDSVVREMDQVPVALRRHEQVTLELALVLDVDEGVEDRFSEELDRLHGFS